jgi:tyrosyl-tRNA synthetase
LHPKEAKLRLAQILVSQYHSAKEGEQARAAFDRVFSRKEVPLDMPEYITDGTQGIVTILLSSGMVKSGNEARRLIQQGAVFFDNENITKEDFLIQRPGILKAGSRRYLRIIL